MERATAADLGQLASDAGSVPNQIGAVLILDRDGAFDPARTGTMIGERLARVPRLRQRLVSLPMGYGANIWVDDPRFDVAEHVSVVRWPPPGSESALQELAARLVTTPLPRARPLWSVTLAAGMEQDRVGLIVVFHHVMADGIGGLAVLAQLLDDGPPAGELLSPRRPPSRGQLRRDASARRRSTLRELPRSVVGLRAAIRELGDRPTVARRCSLNAPTGSRRRIAVVRADLARMVAFARAHDATVNDVLLVAVANALGAVLRHRGEDLDQLVASIPIAARTRNGASIGNRAGVAPIVLPLRGTLDDRLRRVSAATRNRKADPGASAALLGLGLRLLARLRIPISLTTGNVTIAFAALSYAGTFVVTVVADPDRHPDLDVLVHALGDELPFGVRERGSP